MFAWSNNWYIRIRRQLCAEKVKTSEKRKDGRWEARFIKYRDSEGKIHYGSIYGKTYSEVKAKRNKKIAELPQYGYHTGNSGVLNYQATFQTAAIRWQQDIRYTIKDSTFSNYKAILENQQLPELGTTQIRKITNARINQFIHRKESGTVFWNHSRYFKRAPEYSWLCSEAGRLYQ